MNVSLPHHRVTYLSVVALVFFMMIIGFFPLSRAQAHPLVPPEVLTFLEENPDATADDIEKFYLSLPRQTQDISTAKLLSAVNANDATLLQNMQTFIYLGITHILSGLDHVLFLFSLILVYVSLRHTIKLVSAFTVAHTITFIIAGTHLFTLSPRIVEPLIALSISVMAFMTVFMRKHNLFSGSRSKIFIVFAFGLFHGLGFAGLLDEFTIPAGRFLESLLFFNLGIEIGQLLILACILPLILILRGTRWYPLFQKTTAALLIVIGLFWFVERIMA